MRRKIAGYCSRRRRKLMGNTTTCRYCRVSDVRFPIPLLSGYIVARVAPYPRRLFVLRSTGSGLSLVRVRVEVSLCFRNKADHREGVIRVGTDSRTLCDIRKHSSQCYGLNPSCKHRRFPSSTAVSVALLPNES